jgi:hypothetical protein
MESLRCNALHRMRDAAEADGPNPRRA